MIFDIESFYEKTLLNEKIPWVKKGGSGDFDIPMGYFDGAEVCELVGTFILNKLKNVFQNNTFGLYRDDRLVVIKGLSDPEIGRPKKNIDKTFKDCRLNITIEANLHTATMLMRLWFCKKTHICPTESQIIHQFT